MTWLKRSLKLGEKIGDFVLSIRMLRSGHVIEVRADVHHRAGDFRLHARRHDWKDAFREMIRMLTTQLHAQRLQRMG